MRGPFFWVFVVLPVAVSCQSKPDGKAVFARPELEQQLSQCLQGQSKEIIIRKQPVTDADFSRILSARGLQVLELYHCDMTGLAGIAQLKDLRRLRLEAFPCNDMSAREISKLRQLTILNLPDASFTDDGLAAIATLPDLELLRFGSPNVADSGLACLANLKTLRFLHFMNVPVTDSGLKVLHGMNQLESLYIDGGLQTDEGIRLLLQENSELHFHRDQLHLPGDSRADGH